MNVANTEVDLDAYLARIDVRDKPAPTREALFSIHFAHSTSIPFENLDVFLGRPIRIDLASVQAKLVQGRRGGYCFEQNALLAAVLERLRFRVTRLAARVRWGVERIIPRTHMALLVDVEGQPWLADVGFGSFGLLEPIPLAADQEFEQFGWRYRLTRDGDLWVLATRRPDRWYDLYVFTLEPQHPADYEPLNHYVATHPDSRFVQNLIVSRSTPEQRLILKNRDLLTATPTGSTSRPVSNDAELRAVIEEHFGLVLPRDATIRLPAERALQSDSQGPTTDE